MNTQPELRIGDAEREAAASALGEHFASGRLAHEEYDERSAQVWTAKTSSDLGPLFADLPSSQVNHLSRSTASPTGAQRHDRGAWSHRGWGGMPFIPVMLALVVLLIALPGPPWPLFIVGWLWFAGFFRGGWFGWSHRGHPRGHR